MPVKNFLPKKQKAAAIRQLKGLQLDSVVKAVNKAEKGFLELFFQRKDIVSEGCTWQVQISRYLQRHLSEMAIVDPFLVRISHEIAQVLQMGSVGLFSIVPCAPEESNPLRFSRRSE